MTAHIARCARFPFSAGSTPAKRKRAMWGTCRLYAQTAPSEWNNTRPANIKVNRAERRRGGDDIR